MISQKIATALAVVATLGLAFAAAPASAVVYCKTVGVPKGCTARPVGTTAVVAPVAKTAVVATPRVGAAGGVGGPASGVGVLPGAGAGAAGGPGYAAANQNGGVNRVGRR
jgi:hypothetical protein